MSVVQATGRVTRRAAIGAMAAAGLGFAVFGPRGERERIKGRVVLDYWEKWTNQEAAAMQRVVDEFNQSQDRIYVRYLTMAAIDQKAMIAIAGGDPPDIVGLWMYNIPKYASSGALTPLDEMAAGVGLGPEHYAKAVWPLMTYRDRLWGMVNTCGTVALYYNRPMLAAAGLDPDRPPRTIAELDEAAERLSSVGADGRVERMGFLHTEPGWWPWMWGYYFGGSVYDAAADRATAATPPNVQGYDWVQSYPRRYGADPLIRFQTGFGNYDSAQQGFVSGKVAMVGQGPWLANVINRHRPDLDYGVTPMPVREDLYDASRPIGLLDSDVLVIPKGARHPEEAFEFIAFTQQQRIVEQLSRAHCKNSPLRVSSEAFLKDHPNKYVRVHNAIAASDRAFIIPRTRVVKEYVAEFQSALDRMWRLQEAPAVSLDRIERRGQAMIDRAAEQQRRRARIRGERA